MNWTDLLKAEMTSAYTTTEKLMDLVDADTLGWKPPAGQNWMTTGQLLMHLSDACGAPCRGFATGEWGLPQGVSPADMKPDDMLPPAEKMPSITSVAEAKRLLSEDRKTAFRMIEETGEQGLLTKVAPAPWDPRPLPLGERFLQMAEHLKQHKGQLYYYLKLQGKPVNTGHLWGM